MSLAAKLKKFKLSELIVILFFAVTGILFLVFLPLTGFPPHVGFLGILSLITAYSLFTKRGWAPWLIAIQFVVNSVFALYTLYFVGFSNILIALSMIGYAVLTWLVTLYTVLKRKS